MDDHPRHMDPIDSVTTGIVDDGNRDLAVIIDDLRNAYLTDEPLRRDPELVEFLATTTPPVSDAESPRRGLRVVGAVTAGVAGKIFLGAAVAAASVAGLQASGAIDIPGLPGPSESSQEDVDGQVSVPTTVVTVDGEVEADADGAAADDSTAVGPAEAADGGQATAANAQLQRERAAELAAAREQWQACIDAATDDESVAACGPRPHPRDFGITEPPTDRPDQAGPPAHAGPPAEAGPPAQPGPPAQAGPPAQPGPPAQAGPPADTGRPEDPGNSGTGGNGGGKNGSG